MTQKKSQVVEELQPITDEEMQACVKIIKEAFVPALEKNIAALNTLLKQRNVQAGMDIQWILKPIARSKDDGNKGN